MVVKPCEVNIIFESYGVSVPKYDPKHKYNFDSVKNIKIIVFVFEDLHRFSNIKTLNDFIYPTIFLFFLPRPKQRKYTQRYN